MQNYNKGITLVVLVVTIIVLLILAAVSLNLVSGTDGILGRATKAVDETNKAKIAEEIELALAELKTAYYEDRYVNRTTNKTFGEYAKDKLSEKDASGNATGIATSSGKITLEEGKINFTETGKTEPSATGEFNEVDGTITDIQTSTNGDSEGENKVTIPEGLEVGSLVSYAPSGTYNWQAQYASSDLATDGSADVTLSSATGEDFNIESWKVFKIDENTGEVQLVPNAPTTGKVRLQGANGYNNSVKLLNDACSALYSNTAKGISARSIKIEDIEEVLDYDKTTYKGQYDYDTSTRTGLYVDYGKQLSYAYDTNKQYPAIYAEEVDSVITPAPEGKTKTLGLSDAASDWVTGSVTAGTSIQPKLTRYYLSYSDFSSKLNEGYSDVLLPNGKSTQYWVASRCVYLNSSNCYFYVRIVYSGYLGGNYMFYSNGTPNCNERPVFPVVSLSSELIAGDATAGWSVE